MLTVGGVRNLIVRYLKTSATNETIEAIWLDLCK